MSHTPEHPEKYVCLDCHVVYAGTVIHQDDGSHKFEAPDECAVCGHGEFVTEEQYVHHHK